MVKGMYAIAGAVGLIVGAGLLAVVFAAEPPRQGKTYRSPWDVAYSPDGAMLAVSDRTAGEVVLFDAAGKSVKQRVALQMPAALAWAADSKKLYAVEYGAGAVAEISAADGKVLRRFPVGPYPTGVAVAAKKNLLLATSTALGDVRVIDLGSGNQTKRIKASREPFWVAVTPDESMAVVSNLLPAGPAIEPLTTTPLTLIDLNKLEKVADVPLPPNTGSIRQVAISPDGAWAYAVHTVGRTTLPATQLERGWVNTNALSIVDLKQKKHYATMLLDNLSEGAADPWGIALSKDGGTMWISIAGIHQVAKLDMTKLHEALRGEGPIVEASAAAKKSYSAPAVWAEIKADPARRADLVNDLAALYAANLIQRINIPGKAPRGISLAPDGRTLAVGMYFTGEIHLLTPEDCKPQGSLACGPQPEADEARKGEIIFNDASFSFQHWLSCNTCHPNGGRADGFNWDMPNDGIGNPKNAKSLLLAHRTPPMMSLGIREDMDMAAAAGFRFAAFQPQSEQLKATQAYVRSLQPELSPYLVNGQLSEKAKRGKQIFESDAVGCAHCHSGELHTNLKQYDVGTQGPLDYKEHTTFDTPTLVELWRSSPYLHDGRATTLQELMTRYNTGDKHGKTSQLTKEQIEDLAEYMLSL